MLPMELMKILACPACKGSLSPNDAADSLRCQACGLDFPVRDGIPVMLVEEAGHFSPQSAEGKKP